MFSAKRSTRNLNDGIRFFLFPYGHILPPSELQPKPHLSLVYRAKSVVSIEVTVLSAPLALSSKLSNPHDRISYMEALEEGKCNIENK